MANPFLKLIEHLRRGTLTKRIQDELRIRSWNRRKKNWDSLQGTGGFIDYKLEPGVKIRLFANSRLGRHILLEEFEKTELNYLRSILKRGDVFIDVGANIGLYSILAAKWVGPTGRVFAVEPSAETCEQLRGNIERNGLKNITIIHAAASEKIGKITLNSAAEGMDAYSSIGKPIEGSVIHQETVDTITLDSLVAQHNLKGRIRAVKIDVEGWELPVLLGAAALIAPKDAPVLQVEFTQAAAVSAGFDCAQVYGQLRNSGYRIKAFNRAGELESEAQQMPYLDGYAKNLIAMKDQSSGR